MSKFSLTSSQIRKLERALRDPEEGSRPAPSPSSGPAPGIPSIRRYEIFEPLGEGSSAVVYRARDRQLDRLVALKVLKESVAARDVARQRFLREAQAAARFSHPNLVTVHDAGEEEGRLFLVMELVPGRPLHQILAESPVDRRALLTLLAKVASAIHQVHELGVVHRDLKPANILVTPDGEPKVADFGLAHLKGSESALTKSGVTVGTPCYMAPEQVLGRVNEISPRTDVYALGAILYEALTGLPPHTGTTVMDLYGKIVSDEPVPPRRKDPSIEIDLETLCLKAIQKAPADRYSTAEAFAGDLRRHLAGEPIHARPLSWPRRVARRLRRSRRTVVLVPILLALAGALVWLAGNSSRQREVFHLLELGRPALDRASRFLYRGDARYEDLVRAVDEGHGAIEEAVTRAPHLALGHYLLGRAWEIKGWIGKAEEFWRRAIAEESNFGPAHYRLGRSLLLRAFLKTCTGYAEVVGPVQREADALVREASDHLDAARARGSGFDDEMALEVATGLLAYVRRDFSSVERIARNGIARYGTVEGAEDFHWLAGLAIDSPEARIPHYTRAIELRPKHALALFCRGGARSELKDWGGALADYDELLSIHARFADALNNRAYVRSQMRDWNGALSDSDAAVDLDPECAPYRVGRGLARTWTGDLPGALEDFDVAIRLRPGICSYHLYRGSTRGLGGDLNGALLDYDEALHLDPNRAEAYQRRGVARRELGDLAGALEALDAAIRLRPRCRDYHIDRGLIRRLRGDLPGALVDYDEAIEIDPDCAEAYKHRGVAHMALKNFTEAFADCDEAVRLNPKDPLNYYNRAVARLKRDGKADGAAVESDLRAALNLAPADWSFRREVEQLLADFRVGK